MSLKGKEHTYILHTVNEMWLKIYPVHHTDPSVSIDKKESL